MWSLWPVFKWKLVPNHRYHLMILHSSWCISNNYPISITRERIHSNTSRTQYLYMITAFPYQWPLINVTFLYVQKDWNLFVTSRFFKIWLLVNSCSCPPLSTLDTLLVFLDTIVKHWTCENCHMSYASITISVLENCNFSHTSHVSVSNAYLTNILFPVTIITSG